MAESAVKEPRGTGWRIWDLHVHTPASIVQGYGGDTDEAWARFIDDLEELPEDVSVIGINDYWFLDGYKRIIAERNNGRLQNLDAVFPVVEMRLDQFGGTEGNLSRVNLHVIFDPAIEVEVIEAQFLNALNSQARLSPSYQQLGWKGVITRDSLADFGQRIKQSVPQDRINQYGTDLEEGFNNLNVSLAAVQSILSGPYFQGKALLGIGKTEWAGIKWTDQSIAAKKTVINSADLVFTAFSDVTRWTKDVSLLRDNNVTHKLLDCSDAHHFSNSSQDMRLGKCQTWMNTSPTFAGLTYALREFDRRVFVGLEPPALARVRKNPERFISSVTVGSNKQNYNLFDYSIPLNAGFVAVVGNKGQGKSALLDCIALAGNSSRNKEFAFLNTSRFLRTPSAKIAEEYSSELEWANAAVRRVKLTDEHDRSAPVYVEYLPQKFVERVCNIDPTVDEVDEFESELRAVLFTHISEEQRSGEKTFDDLLSQKKRVTQETIDRLREELGELVSSYTSLANFRAENLATDVDGRLALKEEEVQAATTALDVERERLEQIDSESNGNLHLSNLKRLFLIQSASRCCARPPEWMSDRKM
nr:ATP-binding protein [Gordonia sp. CNJ-863]